MGQIKFFAASEIGPRPWGQELLVAHAEGKYIGKVLLMKAGTKGGLQKHRLKDESGYIFSGELLVRYDDGTGNLRERVLHAGDCLHIPPDTVHQEEALTDCVIFETSTPHFNDRVRCEEQYGLSKEGGLPSTSIDEIETR